jgi:hypothetical protein
MSAFLSTVVILLLIVTSVGILLAQTWRWAIIFMAAQYIGMFILTLQHWPLGMAAVKLTAGWMSAAILGMTRSNMDEDDPSTQNTLPQGRLFRLIAASIILFVAFSGAPAADALMADAGLPVATGSLILVGMGLLHLGVTDRILRLTIGLLTVLAGFEVLYASVESSLLVAALLAVVNLGLALVGSYLMIAHNTKKSEPA